MGRPWRTLALAVLAAAILVAVIAAPRVGLSWDEEHSAQNGEYAAAWYRTFGKDDRVITSFNQRFYGSAPRPMSLPAGDYRIEVVDADGSIQLTKSVALGATPMLLELGR